MAHFKITVPLHELIVKANLDPLGCERYCDIQILSYEDMETILSTLKRMYPLEYASYTLGDLAKLTGLSSRGRHVCNTNLKNSKITQNDIMEQPVCPMKLASSDQVDPKVLP